MAETTYRAKIAIVGGGLVGFSIAYHLTKLGESDVVVVEREEALGLHSTGKSAGGFRAQFTSEINIRMSLLSIPELIRFPEEVDPNAYVQQVGYLFLATTEEELNQFRENVSFQRELGLEEVVLIEEPRELLKYSPVINVEDLVGGTFSPSDGFFDPYEIMMGYQKRAREAGVKVLLGAEVTAFESTNHRVSGLVTSKGLIECEQVVIAAGAWSGRIAKLVGVEVPIEPIVRKLLDTEPIPQIPMTNPLTIDIHTGFYFRPDTGNTVLMGWADPTEPSFEGEVDWEWKMKVVEMAIHRVPVLAEAKLRDGWWGLYDTTPDHHAVIDRLDPWENLFMAAGFSGHGAMHSPATGRLMAEWLVFGEPKSLDISPLTYQRFARGELIHERNVI